MLDAWEPNLRRWRHKNVRSFRRYRIAAIALAIVAAACSSGHTTRPASSSVTTTTTNTQTVTTMPYPVAGLTAEQMEAHLGVGVPKGWVPVDEGDARVFVPHTWTFEFEPICTGTNPGVVDMGQDGQNECPHPKPWLALMPYLQANPEHPALIVHGYRIYDSNRARAVSWPVYDIPQLGVSIATYGALGSRILDTLAPSALNVAVVTATKSVPDHWHALTKDGVSLSIPPSWLVTTLGSACGLFERDSELFFVPPNVPSCPTHGPFGPTGPPPFPPIQSGAYLYESKHNIYAPTVPRGSVATLHHGPTTITIYDEAYSPPTLDLFVRIIGSKITHVLTLGLGRDGRIGGGVLASIRATT